MGAHHHPASDLNAARNAPRIPRDPRVRPGGASFPPLMMGSIPVWKVGTMPKRISVTLTERQWDDVLSIMGDGFEHLDMVIDGGNDRETVSHCRAMVRRGHQVDSRIREQLNEGGVA